MRLPSMIVCGFLVACAGAKTKPTGQRAASPPPTTECKGGVEPTTIAELLASATWCKYGSVLPVGETRPQRSYKTYAFEPNGKARLEQGVFDDAGRSITPTVTQRMTYQVTGCWRASGERAEFSDDGRRWFAIEVIDEGRIRVGDEECGRCAEIRLNGITR